ncbi:MAG: outer membrane protein transport protein [Candidatus Kapabacteria bacterium]|nr:outer membrane protein transport protein [Candidatus Kapabacteria bacterium]
MNRFIFTTFSFFILALSAFAGGFQLNDHNARVLGMGFSSVANMDDASSNYYNPACMTMSKSDIDVSLGASYIMPGGKFTGPTDYNQQNTTALKTWNFTIPNLYASYRTPLKDLSVGLGVFIPFGLGTRWPSDWVGRFTAVETYLQTIEINPNLAYKLDLAGMPLAISAGFGYAMGSVEMSKNISTFSPEPVLHLKGTGNGTTFNAGLFFQPMKSLKIGASYRHNIKIDYSGDVTYDSIAKAEALFQKGTGKTTMNLPNDFRFGIAYQLADNFWVEASMNYVGWSSYDTLTLTLDKKPGSPTTSYTVSYPRLYNNVIAFRLGAEYQMKENLALRCGLSYDPIPVDVNNISPMLPEGNRIISSLGIGYKINKSVSFDLGYMFVYAMQVESKTNKDLFNGIYNSWANIVSLSLNYKL